MADPLVKLMIHYFNQVNDETQFYNFASKYFKKKS